jgi:hypothetical protein
LPPTMRRSENAKDSVDLVDRRSPFDGSLVRIQSIGLRVQ